MICGDFMGGNRYCNDSEVTFEQACGLDDSLILPGAMEQPLHLAVLEPISYLKKAAAEQGFDLRVASGYRSFLRQMAIWNAKAEGLRPVLDDQNQPVCMSDLSDRQKVFAILRWSALPGASRHHWGTDIDIFDAASVTEDYRVQLTTAETIAEGPFAPLHRWLDQWLCRQDIFFRPYVAGVGRISPEPWHLSCLPLSHAFAVALDSDKLYDLVRSVDIALKDALLKDWQIIVEGYISPYR